MSNPKTGEPVDVPAKRVPYFKPGKELKEFFTERPAAGSSSDAAAAPETRPDAEPQEPANASQTESGESSSGGSIS